MINPNHPTHADSYAMYEAADQLGIPFYFMAAWQVFGMEGWLGRRVLQHHGCFSVDREGMDRRAFRQAVEILAQRPNPLVVFPEGEVYHVNDRVTPFREGAVAIALAASRRSEREVCCIPCGLRYQYVEDPTPELNALMDELEKEIFWRPRRDLPLDQRVYRFAEGALALKELEYLGRTSSGPLPERLTQLTESILGKLEQSYGSTRKAVTIPERVKALRHQVITELDGLTENDPKHTDLIEALDDLFLVVQLFSYPGDYISEKPNVERLAETLDKFEEDVLNRFTATIRGTRQATVAFGEPFMVEGMERGKSDVHELTHVLEQRVQGLLDDMSSSTSPSSTAD